MTDTANQSGRTSFRKYKKEIRAYLEKRDLEFFKANIDNNVFRALQSLIFDGDELIKWRAIEAIGINSAEIFKSEPNRVREYLRRFFWSMNDESGNLCWHAPEAIGEILCNTPKLINEYGMMLCSFIIEEPFEAGTRLALARISAHNKELFWAIIDRIRATLRSDDSRIRAASIVMMKEAGYKIGDNDIDRLSKDDSIVKLYNYDTGALKTVAIKDLV